MSSSNMMKAEARMHEVAIENKVRLDVIHASATDEQKIRWVNAGRNNACREINEKFGCGLLLAAAYLVHYLNS
jgi:hypothetical protein